MEMRNLKVTVNNLAAGVKLPKDLIVVFQAGGQVQLHVCTQADCNTDPSHNAINKLYFNVLSFDDDGGKGLSSTCSVHCSHVQP